MARDRRRMGRRPAVKFFPHGHLHVWDVMSQEDTSSVRPEDRHHTAQPARASSNSRSNNRGRKYPKVDGEALSIRPHSHDRDHQQVKQEPDSPPTTHTSSTSTSNPTDLNDNDEDTTVPTYPSLSNALMFGERPIKEAWKNPMIAVINSRQFSIFHAPFLVGSSFNADLQRVLRSVFILPSSTMTDAYMAFLGLTRHYYQIPLPEGIVASGGRGAGNVSDV